ncbi:hypothetical protein TNCV_1693291 [Trichonephila clavipes]|nr:hypothetical protein TNCV_1693291 [Trichonephila clavipes]
MVSDNRHSGVTSSRGVNSHLPIHNRFYGFTSWSRTRTTPIDCPWIFMINQLGSDQCTWPWGHCLLSELREGRFCEWNTRNRWRDGQVCPDVDKELWRLGPDGSGVRRGDPEKKKRGGDPKGEVEKKSSEKTRAGFEEAEMRIPECCSVMLTRNPKRG